MYIHITKRYSLIIFSAKVDNIFFFIKLMSFCSFIQVIFLKHIHKCECLCMTNSSCDVPQSDLFFFFVTSWVNFVAQDLLMNVEVEWMDTWKIDIYLHKSQNDYKTKCVYRFDARLNALFDIPCHMRYLLFMCVCVCVWTPTLMTLHNSTINTNTIKARSSCSSVRKKRAPTKAGRGSGCGGRKK